MLKRVLVDQLTVGMYIAEVEAASYLDHPFWRKSFRIADAAELARVKRSGIVGAKIDTSKGADLPAPPPPSPPPPAPPSLPLFDTEPQALDEEEERFVAEATAPMALMDLPDTRASVRPRASHLDGATPGERAVALRKRARDKLVSMFGEARMGRAIDTEDCLPLVDDISASVDRDPGSFISLVRLKRQDEYTYMHSVAVCALMVGLARQIGMSTDQVRLAGLAGLMHDVGKAQMPLDILNKPGKLTDDEFRVMKSHPQLGFELVRGAAHDAVADVCLHHHEKVDGSGYPHGLASGGITLYAKMGAVCDVYDAITSNRPYKKAWDPGESLRQMAQWKGHFDNAVFQAFVKTVGIYPVGTLVRLQSERLAVVFEQSSSSLLTPKVKAMFSIRSRLRIPPEEVDLASPWCKDKITSVERAEDWKLTDLDNYWAPPNRI